jgi:hypothetical protein
MKMKNSRLMIAIFMGLSIGSTAFADVVGQQQGSSTNVGSSSTAAATNAGNVQNNGSSSSSGVNSTFNPVINFNSPDKTVIDSTSNNTTREHTTIDGRTEQVVSGGRHDIVEYKGSQTIKNVPSVNGPPLVSSNDTCMGSASGSVNGPGFGLGFGKTYTDANCVLLKNSRELWNMGMKAASMALMCKDADNREALELTGFVCPQTARDNKRAEAAMELKQTASIAQPAEVGKTVVSTDRATKLADGYATANLNDPYIARRAQK